MIDNNVLIYKKQRIKDLCPYGESHFCDGKPNKSVDPKGKRIMPCPRYHACELREFSIFETRKE